MTLKTWLLFLVMETALSLSPGPAVFYVVSQGIRGALRRTFPAAVGILTANGIYFALSATSFGTVPKTGELRTSTAWTFCSAGDRKPGSIADGALTLMTSRPMPPIEPGRSIATTVAWAAPSEPGSRHRGPTAQQRSPLPPQARSTTSRRNRLAGTHWSPKLVPFLTATDRAMADSR